MSNVHSPPINVSDTFPSLIGSLALWGRVFLPLGGRSLELLLYLALAGLVGFGRVVELVDEYCCISSGID